MDKDYLTDLTSKVYQLTLLFPKKEPLRYKLREVAIDFLAKFLNSKTKNSLSQDFQVIESLLKVAENQNWVKKELIEQILHGYRSVIEELEKKSVPLGLNERQTKILEILKEKQKLQIWQIKEHFPEVSKRTLRRDLVKLVEGGLVLRTGEVSNTFYQIKNE